MFTGNKIKCSQLIKVLLKVMHREWNFLSCFWSQHGGLQSAQFQFEWSLKHTLFSFGVSLIFFSSGYSSFSKVQSIQDVTIKIWDRVNSQLCWKWQEWSSASQADYQDIWPSKPAFPFVSLWFFLSFIKDSENWLMKSLGFQVAFSGLLCLWEKFDLKSLSVSSDSSVVFN